MKQPLSSNDLAKMLIFAMLLLPIIGFGVGVIPVVFLIFGIFMIKKTQEFSHIQTAVRNFKAYMWLAFAIGVVFLIYWFNVKPSEYEAEKNIFEQYHRSEYLITALLFTIVPSLYIMFVNALFLAPLTEHQESVTTDGFFPKASKKSNSNNEVDIIKAERLRSYSVADELLKWAQLKTDGHISQAEFDEARAKILKK